MDIESIQLLSHKHPILAYDGVCLLCNGYVNWLLKHDHREIFRYTTLQDSPSIKDSLPVKDNDTVVLYRAGKVYTHSDVGLMVMKDLGGVWSTLSILLLIPKIVRDTVYRWIARNRYRWFGKADTCLLLPVEKRHLVLK